MTTVTVNIDNDKDLPMLKAMLIKFGMSYKVNKNATLAKDEDKLFKRLKTSFTEVRDWEAGNTKLQNAKDAIAEIEAELNNGL